MQQKHLNQVTSSLDPIRLIVAGGREFTDYARTEAYLKTALRKRHASEVTVVCGLARGADTMGLQFAREYGIAVEEFPADWAKYGKSAGYKRNAQMAYDATHLVAFWDGKSKGTKHMIDIATAEGLYVKVIKY